MHCAQVNLEDDSAWRAFLGGLQRRGQFAGTAEGSDAHRQLLAEAQQAFRRWAAYERTTAELAAPADCVDALLQVPQLRTRRACTRAFQSVEHLPITPGFIGDTPYRSSLA